MAAANKGGRKRLVWIVVLLTVAAAMGVFGFSVRQPWFQTGTELPSAPARQGDFLVMVKCRGELVARRSVQVIAPTDVPDLRIVWLAPPSGQVKAGEAVLRFDSSSATRTLREKQAELTQAEAKLKEAEAEARTTAEKDARDLSKARYEVEKARMEVARQEVMSAIQAEEARINLDLATEKLRVQEATNAFNEASSKAKIAALERAREKADDDVELMQYRLSQMEVKAPISGVIIYLPNYSQGWMNAQPFKIGDQVWPGAAVAEIPDLETLEIEGKIEEIERGRVAEGAEVKIRIDSLPELRIDGKLRSISALAQLSFEWPPTSTFRGFAPIEKPDARLRPGMNGTMDVVVEKIPGATIVPSKALFTRDGEPVVFVQQGKSQKMAKVEVVARNPDEVAVRGLEPGTMVTIVEPKATASEPMAQGGAS